MTLKRGETLQIFETILIFLALVILSSFLHTFLPKIPLAFIQIILGMLLYVTPIPVQFNFDSELFMVALIAPLLFVEGVKVSRANDGIRVGSDNCDCSRFICALDLA